jgi:HK97 family phage major capsid protein
VIAQALPTIATTLTGKLMLCVGDMEQAAALGMRRDLVVRRSDETFADIDQILLRLTERVDIVPHDLGDATNPGTLVGLFAP